MELKIYLRMLLRSWWIVALTALAAVTVALINAYLATPQYSTQARFLISPSKLLNATDFTRLLEGGNFVPTFAEIWNSNTAFDSTGEALQMDSSDLNDYSRSAVIAPSAQVIELTVTGPNPVQAALIANTLGAFAMAETNDNFGNVVAISVLDAAQAPRPDRPISPQPARDAGLALALGLVIGSVLAIGREQLRVPLEALRRRTTIDGESSAFTHTYFQRSIDDELTRNRGGQVSLGLVHLSGLDDLYENMPPLVKQRLMQYVTKTLQKELRGSDSVGRWTDTSFGVLLPATPVQPAVRTLERIQRALTRPVEIDKGDRFDLSPYVGVAVVSGDQPASTLTTQAESALNDARRSSQNLVLYTEREVESPQRETKVEPSLSLAPTVESAKTENDHGILANAPVELKPVQVEISQTESVEVNLPEAEAEKVDAEVAKVELAQLEISQIESAEDSSSDAEAEKVDAEVAKVEPAQLETSQVESAEDSSSDADAEKVDAEVARVEPAQLEINETNLASDELAEPVAAKDEDAA